MSVYVLQVALLFAQIIQGQSTKSTWIILWDVMLPTNFKFYRGDLQEYLRFVETIKSLKHYLKHSQVGIIFLYDFRMVILELFGTQLVS